MDYAVYVSTVIKLKAHQLETRRPIVLESLPSSVPTFKLLSEILNITDVYDLLSAMHLASELHMMHCVRTRSIALEALKGRKFVFRIKWEVYYGPIPAHFEASSHLEPS